MTNDEVWPALEPKLREWLEAERKKTGAINTNVMTAGLIVASKARSGLPISDDQLFSKGKSQVSGLSGVAISRLLQEHGENRKFTSEGGRTSRRTARLAESIRDLLQEFDGTSTHGHQISPDIAFKAEAFFVDRLREEYFDKQTIQVELSPEQPVSVAVGKILEASRQRADKNAGAVLQHLVGAKLELRFPDSEIGRDSYTTADVQTDRQGDFQVGDTAFHVTMSPMEKLMQRCRENFASGYRPVIIAAADRIAAAEQLALVAGIEAQVNVVSAESFIGTNIEEIGGYKRDQIRATLSNLLNCYNARIVEIEVDQSLRIELPSWAYAKSGQTISTG